jgi:hypothetical protein
MVGWSVTRGAAHHRRTAATRLFGGVCSSSNLHPTQWVGILFMEVGGQPGHAGQPERALTEGNPVENPALSAGLNNRVRG